MKRRVVHKGDCRVHIFNSCIAQQIKKMAAESETDYKEGAFDNDQVDVPVKVHIIAPSTLPEGYEFEAEIGAPGAKKTINVEVVSVVGRLAGLICYIIC